MHKYKEQLNTTEIPNNKKRYSEEEFAKGLHEHLKAKPDNFTDEQLYRQSQAKAKHYKNALNELDSVSKRLTRLAEIQGDDALKKEIDFSISRIERAIGAYGEASMVFNQEYGSWREPDKIDD